MYQNLERVNHIIQVGNKSFECVTECCYSETTRTYQNCIHLEVRSTLKSGKYDDDSAQNLAL